MVSIELKWKSVIYVDRPALEYEFNINNRPILRRPSVWLDGDGIYLGNIKVLLNPVRIIWPEDEVSAWGLSILSHAAEQADFAFDAWTQCFSKEEALEILNNSLPFVDEDDAYFTDGKKRIMPHECNLKRPNAKGVLHTTIEGVAITIGFVRSAIHTPIGKKIWSHPEIPNLFSGFMDAEKRLERIYLPLSKKTLKKRSGVAQLFDVKTNTVVLAEIFGNFARPITFNEEEL